MRLVRAGRQRANRGRVDLFRLQPPAVGGAALLLDTYPAFAAYSTRLLSSTYAGSCLRVRESNTNTEADIGFSGGWVDEAAIAAHCGIYTGFVVTMYDQSGNGYNVTQVTDGNQPQIYNGSAVLKENGKPALLKQTTATYLLETFTVSQPNTWFCVGRIGTSVGRLMGASQAATQQSFANASGTLYLDAGALLGSTYSGSVDTQLIFTGLCNSTNSIFRINSSDEVTGNAGTESIGSALYLMNGNLRTQAADVFQESIIYNSDQSANFSAIESDINTAFSVYV